MGFFSPPFEAPLSKQQPEADVCVCVDDDNKNVWCHLPGKGTGVIASAP